MLHRRPNEFEEMPHLDRRWRQLERMVVAELRQPRPRIGSALGNRRFGRVGDLEDGQLAARQSRGGSPIGPSEEVVDGPLLEPLGEVEDL